MNSYFPTFQSRNIKLFYLFPFLFGSWLVIPNWVFFFSRFITLKEIGLIEAISIGIGTFAEVPTGAFSDLFGKKATLMLSKFCIAVGFIGTGFSTNFPSFLVSGIFLFIGYAFQSGALEAFVYDSLVDLKQESHFDVVISRQSFLETFSMFVWMIIGGILYSLDARWVFWTAGLLELAMLVCLLFAVEPKVDTFTFTLKNYLRQTKEGFLHLFNKNLHRFLFTIIITACFVGIFQGVVRQNSAQYFGFDGESFSYVYAVLNLLGAISILQYRKVKDFFGESGFLLIITTLFVVLSLIAWLNPSPIFVSGIVFFLLTVIGSKFSNTLNSSIINSKISSKYRATTLSSLQLLARIPYVLLMLFFVNWVNVSMIGNFFKSMLLILILSLPVSLYILRRK